VVPYAESMARPTNEQGRNGKGSGSGRAEPPKAKAARRVDEPEKTRPSATAKDSVRRAVARPSERREKGADPGGKIGGTIDGKVQGKVEGKGASGAGPRPRPAPTKRTTLPPPSGRYTPPIPKSEKVSPLWVPIVMFACLGIGMAMIILNYVNVLPGPEPSNAYLMAGLGLITIGFITATKYH
jgi:hypothetical protein